ncbi:MAG: hypothetical protein Q9171_000021 [Xanthocarpia ochracea]
MIDLMDMDQQITELHEQIKTARGSQLLLKAHLASLNANPTCDDIRAKITALELEKEELMSRREDFRSGKIQAVSIEEKELAEERMKYWAKKAESRKQIFMELWAIVGDLVPERQKKHELWVGNSSIWVFLWNLLISPCQIELGLEGDEDTGSQDMKVE